MKKRILVLNTNFPPNTSIGTQRILRICKYLDKSRWEIVVLTLKEDYFPERATPHDPKILELLASIPIYRTGKLDINGWLLKIRDLLRGGKQGKNSAPASGRSRKSEPVQGTPERPGFLGKIKRLVSLATDLLEFPDKDIAMLPFAVVRGWRIIRKHKIDVIYSSSPPHSLHLSGMLLKKMTGARLLVDFRDPWARSPWHDDVRAASGMERRKHRWLQWMEQKVVAAADQVVCVSRQMRDDFANYYHQEPETKFRVFYNGYDPDNISQPAPVAARDHVRPLQIVHVGTLYKRRDPVPLMNALAELATETPGLKDRLRVRFIGTVTKELAHVPGMVEEMNLDGLVEFIPPVSYQESFQYMMEADMLMLLQPVTRLQIPGKFYDYICFEKPIFAVGEKDSAVEMLVKNKFGIFADYSNADDLKQTFKNLANGMNFDLGNLRENREFFNMSTSVRKFEAILESALSN